MGDVERDDAERRPARSQDIVRRGHRMRVVLARVEMAMDGLIAVDRLLVLNAALTNVLDDAEGRR